MRHLRNGQSTLSSVGALGGVGNAHARDRLEGVAIFNVPGIEPRMKWELEPSRGRDPKIVQESLHLRGTVTRHTGGAEQVKQPDRGHEGPLHVEDLRGARRSRKVGHPEINPNSKVGHVAAREVIGKRGQKLPRGLKGLA